MTSNRRISVLAAAAALIAGPALADDVVTVGLIVPMTGQSATTGKQEQAGAESLHPARMATRSRARRSSSRSRTTPARADVTKRLAQELIANDNAKVLMGFGLTPLALAVAPVATEAKVPEIVTAAATAMITEKSPYIVRTSFTLPQAAAPMAQWCLKNSIKKVVTHGHRLRPRHRRREMVRRRVQEGRRRRSSRRSARR